METLDNKHNDKNHTQETFSKWKGFFKMEDLLISQCGILPSFGKA